VSQHGTNLKHARPCCLHDFDPALGPLKSAFPLLRAFRPPFKVRKGLQHHDPQFVSRTELPDSHTGRAEVIRVIFLDLSLVMRISKVDRVGEAELNGPESGSRCGSKFVR
jgi:hypothetical protein